MKNFFLIPFFMIFLSNYTFVKANSFNECDEKIFSSSQIYNKSVRGVLHIDVDDDNQGKIGSGFIVGYQDEATLIITNSHVIVGSKRVEVTLTDGKKYPATVVFDGGGESNKNDLAILKVVNKIGKVLTLKENQPVQGEDVLAIGSNYGFSFSSTKGIVSKIWENEGLIQTDTSINSGNSGGPLINHSGCVIGVNTFGIDPSDNGSGDSGLNFAISSEVVKQFIDTFNSSKHEKNGNKSNFESNKTLNQNNEYLFKYF